MLEQPVKILHTGDIQIEVRAQHQRKDEYEFILQKIEDEIKSRKPDIYLLAGDIFENWRANDVERKLFIEHLTRVLDMVKEVVITDGNHDINQQIASNFYVTHGKEEHSPNALETIVQTLNDDRIIYMNSSTSYRSNAFKLTYFNWAQRVKHSNVLTEDYNPISNGAEAFPETTPVTIYHDPIRGARMWDDKEMRNSDRHSALDVFGTPTILAGDIHIPQVISDSEHTFVYCGSPVPRNFGEGDYLVDSVGTQDGMKRHTISVCELNPDGTISNQEFIPIQQYRSYTTFELTTRCLSPVDVNWVIPYQTHDNQVRVKLPSATQTYLEWEPQIIDLIKQENEDLDNIQIHFSYGRAISTDVDRLVTTQDIHQLISEQEIVRVADEYIKKQVNDSRSIPAEDKDKCIHLVTKLFIQELKNYISNIPSNNIQLLSAHISNFMAFGDDVIVDMKSPHDIIKLTGGNGVGKTTFYNAIKWCLTGYVSLSQNRTKKNENNLLVFNDYRRDTDELTVSLLFSVNGQLVVVTRTAFREWKKGTLQEHKHSKKWKSYISNTDTKLSIANRETGAVIIDNEAEAMLGNLFGGLENLSHIVFPSQFTLRSVVCTESARLCEEILRNIGMSFFDKMYDKYDDVRTNVMAKVSKPALSIEAIITKINDLQAEYENLSSEANALEPSINELTSIIEGISGKIAMEQMNLNPDATTDKADELDKTISELQKQYDEKKKSTDDETKECEHYLSIINYDKFTETLKQFETDVNNQADTIMNATDRISALVTQRSSIEKDIASREKEIQSEFASKRKSLTDKLSAHQTLKTTHTVQMNEYERMRQEAINNVKNQINQVINNTKSQDDQLIIKIENITKRCVELMKERDGLLASKVCPTCGRQMSEDTIDHIKTKVDEIMKQYDELSAEKSDLIKQSVALQKKIDETKAKLLAFENDPDIVSSVAKVTGYITAERNAIAEIEQNISIINSDIAQLDKDSASFSDLNIEEWRKQVEAITSEIANETAQLNEKKTAHTKAKEELKTMKDNLDEYTRCQKRLNELKYAYLELETQASKITRLRGDHQNMVRIIAENKEITARIAELSSKRDEHTKELESLTSQKTNIHTKQAVIAKSLEDERANKLNAIKYRIVEASLKQYKTLIGKSGLPQHIFSIIREVLNSKLNDLLVDMDFRLMFDESNQLIMIDLSKPGHPIRRPSQLSGMQTCFTGLALIYVNRMCNNTFIFDHIFIDEVSGQLNSGDELSYESMNYQAQLKKLLRKFTNLKVWIVDHVIDDLGENFRFEVVPSNTGATILPR